MEEMKFKEIPLGGVFSNTTNKDYFMKVLTPDKTEAAVCLMGKEFGPGKTYSSAEGAKFNYYPELSWTVLYKQIEEPKRTEGVENFFDTTEKYKGDKSITYKSTWCVETMEYIKALEKQVQQFKDLLPVLKALETMLDEDEEVANV